MPVDLTREEIGLIVGLLESEQDEIRSEIHHSQNFEFKTGLKEREKLILAILEKLK